jgi:hypothetical protein
MQGVTDGLCRLCGDRHYEMVTHLFHHCRALEEPRQLLRKEVWDDVPSLMGMENFRNHLLRDAPLHAAKFAFEWFPNAQFDWTRNNMMELILGAWKK